MRDGRYERHQAAQLRQNSGHSSGLAVRKSARRSSREIQPRSLAITRGCGRKEKFGGYQNKLGRRIGWRPLRGTEELTERAVVRRNGNGLDGWSVAAIGGTRV